MRSRVKMKNQTVKKTYTITITNDDGFVVDEQMVEAESPREAIRIAYQSILNR